MAQRLLSICFQYRYWDESVYLKEHIAALGQLHAARTWGWQRALLSHQPVPPALGPALSHVQPADIEPSIEDFAMGLVRWAGDAVVTIEANREMAVEKVHTEGEEADA